MLLNGPNCIYEEQQQIKQVQHENNRWQLSLQHNTYNTQLVCVCACVCVLSLRFNCSRLSHMSPSLWLCNDYKYIFCTFPSFLVNLSALSFLLYVQLNASHLSCTCELHVTVIKYAPSSPHSTHKSLPHYNQCKIVCLLPVPAYPHTHITYTPQIFLLMAVYGAFSHNYRNCQMQSQGFVINRKQRQGMAC